MVLPAASRRIEIDHVVLGDFEEAIFLGRFGVVVEEAPEEEGAGLGSVADRASPARTGHIFGEFSPLV